MTAATVPQHSAAEVLAGKIPFWDRVQSVAYSVAAGQWAVGFWSGVYVLVTQAHWFGKSFKYTWDHLNTLWHFRAIPGIGNWMYDNYDLARHIFLRDAPEAVLAYAVVAMIITWLAAKMYQASLARKVLIRLGLAGPKARKVPLIHRIAVRLGMPSIYQGDLGRHPDTSPLQYAFLLPSMLLASLVGEIPVAALIFGTMAIAHSRGYHSPWLEPTSPWVPIIIGIAGGKVYGHMPAVKAGYDTQKFFLGKRLSVTYAADSILAGFREGKITQDKARSELTGMRRADPSLWYPASYRVLYGSLLAARAKVRQYGWLSTVTFAAFIVLFLVVGGWGVYLRKYGISHGFWLPW